MPDLSEGFCLTYKGKAVIFYQQKQITTFAPVAQGIERQPPELKVAGSNPAGRAIGVKSEPSYSIRMFVIAGIIICDYYLIVIQVNSSNKNIYKLPAIL